MVHFLLRWRILAQSKSSWGRRRRRSRRICEKSQKILRTKFRTWSSANFADCIQFETVDNNKAYRKAFWLGCNCWWNWYQSSFVVLRLNERRGKTPASRHWKLSTFFCSHLLKTKKQTKKNFAWIGFDHMHRGKILRTSRLSWRIG